MDNLENLDKKVVNFKTTPHTPQNKDSFADLSVLFSQL